MNRPDLRLFAPTEPEDETEPFEDLPADPVSEAQARSSLHGREFKHIAYEFVESLGARIVETDIRIEDGYHLDAAIEGIDGRRFYLDAHGTPDRTDRPKAAIRRQDTILKFGFKALRLHQRGCQHPLILITSHLPRPKTSAAFLLAELTDVLLDVSAVVGDTRGGNRLATYFREPAWDGRPLSAPWRRTEQLALDFDPFADEPDDEHRDADA